MLTIAVIGAGECDARLAMLAEEIGRQLAQAGARLVCSGLGGVMEAACRGAKSVGRFTIGILPGTNRSEANYWVDIVLPAGMGDARNVLVVRSAQAVSPLAANSAPFPRSRSL